MTIQLDDYERDLLESVERGEWQSIANLQEEIERYQRHAQAYMQSIQKITIELPSSDVASLQELATSSGVSIPLLVSSIIHQYVGSQSIR
jgi:predicted DNA binding CopG/RHH family protein